VERTAEFVTRWSIQDECPRDFNNSVRIRVWLAAGNAGVQTVARENIKEDCNERKERSQKIGHSGSTFDSFLEEEGIREEVEAVAINRVLACQLEHAMRKQQKTKRAMARELHTSRSQLDRLLDPHNVAVTLDAITRAARVLGKRVILRVADTKAAKRPRRLQG
jgi:antitoxin HicB